MKFWLGRTPYLRTFLQTSNPVKGYFYGPQGEHDTRQQEAAGDG